jgi:hypothetical protein
MRVRWWLDYIYTFPKYKTLLDVACMVPIERFAFTDVPEDHNLVVEVVLSIFGFRISLTSPEFPI